MNGDVRSSASPSRDGEPIFEDGQDSWPESHEPAAARKFRESFVKEPDPTPQSGGRFKHFGASVAHAQHYRSIWR
jgi:hypothetical protein